MRRFLFTSLLLFAMILPRAASADPPSTCFDSTVTDNRTTDGQDFLTGTAGGDVAALGLGDDQYFASDGPDTICGNEGSDVIAGEAGADAVSGGSDDDTLLGLGGPDALNGWDGSDHVDGGRGGDIIRAGAGDGVRDDLYDGPGSDTIIGDAEDVWHKCADGDPDDSSGFTGITVPDPDC